jgi:hypothetical protein
MNEIKKTDSGFDDTVFAKAAVSEFIVKMTPFKGHWVHFRSDEDFGLSKDYSNEITPHAIYGLDVDRLLLLAEAQLKTQSPNRTNFHYIGFNRRPIAAIFKSDGVAVTGAGYKDYATHWQNLLSHLQEKHPSAEARVQGFHPRDHYIDVLAFKAILWATEYACDHILELEGEGPYRPHPSKPGLWRELLMASGIDAIEDRSNTLTGDCDHQIAVLNPDKAKLVAVLENPLAPEPVPGFNPR